MITEEARSEQAAEDRAALELALQQAAGVAPNRSAERRRERPQKTPIPKSKAGLSLGYRFIWRLHYTLLAWGGPAQRPLEWDPRERMRRERAEKVAHAQHPAD
ncbi:hypothetical protein [Flexivirga oryzae]|uniref:Uncharacterized protein n=1 Tax=Flexivirga oryzae TaxID=1794944 RepID=A0A839N2F4_9MICO|nr:hypothetical protein [Flexivirga oryzae]MBB2891920.1 hypothetical protein [Flexivirga oryzae]